MSFLPGIPRREFLEFAAGAILNGQEVPIPIRSAWNTFLACPTPADWARISSRGAWKLSRHLALFNRLSLDLAARKITRLAVSCPPRHGKSSFFSRYLPAWWLGTFPDQRVIVTSYGAELATFWSSKARSDFEEYSYRCFRVKVSGRGRAGDNWMISGHEGGMQAAGVGGPLTGRGADLAVIDDPFKNAGEAHSPTQREKIWQWFLSTLLTRLEPGGVIVIINTRWNEDDLVGRLVKQEADEDPETESTPEPWVFVNMPALATQQEASWPVGLGRLPGQALWPQRFDRAKLLQICNKLGPRWWSALYQGSPVPAGGDTFQEDWFRITMSPPLLPRKVRFWDLAATEKKSDNDPDFTAGAKCGLDDMENFYVCDVRTLRDTPAAVVNLLYNTAVLDGPATPIVIEREGGASGKIAIDLIVRELRRRGLRNHKIVGQATGSAPKVARAEPVAGLAENRMLYLVRGPWNQDLITQALSFPHGRHDDIIDAMSGAHAYLAGKRKLDVDSFDIGEQATPGIYNYTPT